VAQHWAGGSDWQYAQRLIAWGCTEMSSSQMPEPAERLWHLAAVAVAQAGEDSTLLLGRRRPAGQPVSTSRNSLENELRQGHVHHALSRFPGEPRFALAAAVAAESLSWEIGGFGRDYNGRGGLMVGEIDSAYLDRLRSGDLASPDGSNQPVPGAKQLGKWHLARVGDVMAVRDRYVALTSQPLVAAEAHLRLALVLFRLVERDKALQHLTLALELAQEPEVVYLAHLLRGAIQERQGLDDEAIAAYRAALDVVPRAQSATSLLVSRLFAAGRRAEAAALADEFFATEEAAPDPWATYRMGEARFLRSYLARLRGSGQ
jgi:tetratricopeptide (TPR) repeat protein